MFLVGTDDIKTNTLDANYFVTNPLPATNGEQFYVASAFDMVLHGWNQVPTETATPPDFSYKTKDGTAAVILHDEFLILPGFKGHLNIWSPLPTAATAPDHSLKPGFLTINSKGFFAGAMDDSYLYLVADDGTLYGFDDVPLDGQAPTFELALQPKPSAVSSDGSHLVLAAAKHVVIYEVDALPSGPPQKVMSPDFSSIQSALIRGEQLFAADRNHNRIYAWKKLSSALDGAPPQVFLGASGSGDINPEIGKASLFWPASLAHDGERLWVGEYKFSGRLVAYETN